MISAQCGTPGSSHHALSVTICRRHAGTSLQLVTLSVEGGTPNGIRTRATAVKVEIKPDGTVSINAVFD
jgi:hypothetical protein